MPSLENARKRRQNIKALKIDSRSGILRAFKHHFFWLIFLLILHTRGPLLWPVLPSVQSLQTPSSSTSHSLIGSESVSSQYQDILSLLLKTEAREKKKKNKKNSENAERTTIRSGQIVTFWLRSWREPKTKRFIIAYKSFLSVLRQEFSLLVWLHVGPKIEPTKMVSADIFGSFYRPKKKFIKPKI